MSKPGKEILTTGQMPRSQPDVLKAEITRLHAILEDLGSRLDLWQTVGVKAVMALGGKMDISAEEHARISAGIAGEDIWAVINWRKDMKSLFCLVELRDGFTLDADDAPADDETGPSSSPEATLP